LDKPQTLLEAMTTLPETLYHYTSMAGLLGIVQSRKIWASHIRYLNDHTEQEHIWSLVENHVSEKLQQCDDPKTRASLFELAGLIAQRSSQETYVASFSSDGDLLSQWLSYCPEGAGVAIGFGRTSMLSNTMVQLKRAIDDGMAAGAPHQFVSPQLSAVFYLTPSKMGYLENLIATGISPRPEHLQTALTALPEPLRVFFQSMQHPFATLTFLEPLVKHAAFLAEKECRLVIKGRPQKLSYRVGTGRLIPYAECELDKGDGYFIDRVIVGPCPDPDLSIKSIKMLFESVGQPSVEVIKSAIPYRSW
jgi:hypothetical protein